MNKNTFKSAYSKLALSEESKSSMKARLMEQMTKGAGVDSTDEDADSHRAQEIKITPKKRSPLKTAIAAGSAAAAVAICSVGAGIWLNNRPLTQHNETPTVEEQSSEESTEAQTNEAYIEDEYYSRRCANGILHFQELTETTAEYTRPMNPVEETFRQSLTEKYTFISTRRLGMDTEYSELIEKNRAAIEQLEGAEAAQESADEMVASLPLGDEMWLSEGRTSDTGIAMVYRSEDGSKQVNFSVSDRSDEFYPITLPDGGYLTPVGEYRSSFTMGTVTQFIDAEMFQMAAGSVTIGDDEYFTAVYSYNVKDFGMKYFRIDGKNITQEQFIGCIGTVSYARMYDHAGFYVGDGLNYDTFTMYGELVQDDSIVPAPSAVQTEWGELTMNVVTHTEIGWDGGFCRNIYNFGKHELPEEYSYTFSDAAEFAGLDVLNEQLIPEDYTNVSVNYKASYAEIPEHLIAGAGFGANEEMLPGDDPEEFEESRQYIEGWYDDGIDVMDSYYITDKIDYFRNKTRTMAVYSVRAFNDSSSRRICIDVFDNWEIFEFMKAGLFARLPAAKTAEFAGVKGELYVCGGPLSGNETYIGCFKTKNGRYVVLQTTNAGLQSFAEILAKLYTNSADPEKLYEVEYPGVTYNISTGETVNTSYGHFTPNAIRLYDYTPSSSADYFTGAEEALAAAEKLGGNGAAILAEKWTLLPEKSAVTRYENGEPAEISLYFTDGDRQILAGIGMVTEDGCSGFSIDVLRLPLPDGSRIDLVGQGAESGMLTGDTLANRHYLSRESSVQAAVGGRVVEGVPYITAKTYRNKFGEVDYSLDSVGLSVKEALDVFAQLVCRTDEVGSAGTPAATEKPDGEPTEWQVGRYYSVDGGTVYLNRLSVYDPPEFSHDSGEQEISGQEAQEFLRENFPEVELPFRQDGYTRRTRSNDEGYSSESVTISGGGKSVRLCRIENGSAATGYGEEFGVDTVYPVALTSLGRKMNRNVVAYGVLPDGSEVFFGIYEDSDSGMIYSVTAENLTLEEFGLVLSKA